MIKRAFRWGTRLLGVAALAISGCSWGDPPSMSSRETDYQSAVQRLTSEGAVSKWRTGTPGPVALYIDRSGSMRGFLDPTLAAESDAAFPSVLDALVVGLHPSSTFGFGSGLTQVTPSLASISDPDFYTDNDTRMEEAIERVNTDTSASATHILVGDGRRGNRLSALGQYDHLRQAAEKWIGRKGLFAVAASLAPFRPVTDDPAGCRMATESGSQTCPLYAFAYIAPGDEVRVTDALAKSFVHLFVWPAPSAPPEGLVLVQEPGDQRFSLNRQWGLTADGAPVARVLGRAEGLAGPVPARVKVDSTAPYFRIVDATIRGNGARLEIFHRPLTPEGSWSSATPSSLIAPGVDGGLGLRLATRGSGASPELYRIDLIPDPSPSWLQGFEATNVTDPHHTFGIGKLFEPFKLESEAPVPIGRMFVVAN
jgi:hypothetical protein